MTELEVQVMRAVTEMEPFVPLSPETEYEAGFLAATRLWHRRLTEED